MKRHKGKPNNTTQRRREYDSNSALLGRKTQYSSRRFCHLLIYSPLTLIAIAMIVLTEASCQNTSSASRPDVPLKQLIIIKEDNGERISIEVEVVSTPAKRRRGLMFRKSLPQDRGMLFIFPRLANQSFWMKNTRIPLSIAFIRDDGYISQIESMKPYSERSHRSRAKVRYALEMNKGWFKQNGVKLGDRVIIPKEIRKTGK